ncbi:hypothetical protein, partial [Pseudotabrizicola sediminis]|uniref:hypothetical protein n=1 Tax=Pseudotabrizicola sediminis TaxID=2486418 RepID=UPI001AEC4E38
VIISDMTAPLCGSIQTHLGTHMPPGGGYIINADQRCKSGFVSASESKECLINGFGCAEMAA